MRSNWQEKVSRNTDTQCNQRVKTSKDKTDFIKKDNKTYLLQFKLCVFWGRGSFKVRDRKRGGGLSANDRGGVRVCGRGQRGKWVGER